MPSKGFENNKENHDGGGAALYIVATPIGNLGDVTTRALETMKAASTIACEDTRVSKKLLSHFGIKTPLTTYHEHNAIKQRPKLLEALERGESVALISDAGTPLISDPGYKLVEEALERGIRVVPIPGASAVITSLMAAGLPTDQFAFLGFLPTKTTALQELLAPWKSMPATMVCFSTPHKITAHLHGIMDIFGECDVVVARELTKLHEEFIRGPIGEVSHKLAEGDKLKGEIVLAFRTNRSDVEDEVEDFDEWLSALLEHMPVKSAVEFAVKHMGSSKNEIYQRALELKSSG